MSRPMKRRTARHFRNEPARRHEPRPAPRRTGTRAGIVRLAILEG